MPVALPGPHQPEVGDDRVLQHELLVPLGRVEDAGLLGRDGDRDVALVVVPPRAGRPRRPGCRRRSRCRTPGSPSRRRASARPACPAGSARPRARRRGTAARTPCSPPRRRRPSGASASRRAAGRGPSRRRRSCSRPPRGRSRPLEQRLDQHRRDPAQPEPPTASVAPSRCRRPPRPPTPTTLSMAHLPAGRRSCHGRGVPEEDRRAPARSRALATLTPHAADFPGVQLHVVTGKGGTGKTTVAAALALALAARRQDRAAVRGRGPAGHRPALRRAPAALRGAAVARRRWPGGRDVYALAIDPESALLEYLEMYYRLGRAGKALDRFGVIEFATTIAPGVRDVLLTGKVYEAANRNRRNKGARQYDAVVLDAPPTGRIAQFLNVNDELAGLAKVGPIKAQADVVMALLRSPPYRDAPGDRAGGDAGAGDRRRHRRAARGRPAGRRRRGQPGPPQDLDDRGAPPALDGTGDRDVDPRQPGRGGLEVDEDDGRRAARGGADHAERRALEDSQRVARRVARACPTYELPRLPGGIDLGGLYELAGLLAPRGAGDDPPSTSSRGAAPRVGPLIATATSRTGGRSTSTPCSTTASRTSSSAAARVASARRPRRPRWRCGPPSAAARWSC